MAGDRDDQRIPSQQPSGDAGRRRLLAGGRRADRSHGPVGLVVQARGLQATAEQQQPSSSPSSTPVLGQAQVVARRSAKPREQQEVAIVAGPRARRRSACRRLAPRRQARTRRRRRQVPAAPCPESAAGRQPPPATATATAPRAARQDPAAVSALSPDVRALRGLPAARHRALPDGRGRVRVPGVLHLVRHVRACAEAPDGDARAELLPVHAVQGGVPDQVGAQGALRHEPRQRAPHVPVQQLHRAVQAAVPDGDRVHRPSAEHALFREIPSAGAAAASAAGSPDEPGE